MKGGGGGEGRPSVEMEEGGGKVSGDSECISGGRVHV